MYEHMILEHKMKSELKQNVSELKEKVAALEKEKEQNA